MNFSERASHVFYRLVGKQRGDSDIETHTGSIIVEMLRDPCTPFRSMFEVEELTAIQHNSTPRKNSASLAEITAQYDISPPEHPHWGIYDFDTYSDARVFWLAKIQESIFMGAN